MVLNVVLNLVLSLVLYVFYHRQRHHHHHRRRRFYCCHQNKVKVIGGEYSLQNCVVSTELQRKFIYQS